MQPGLNLYTNITGTLMKDILTNHFPFSTTHSSNILTRLQDISGNPKHTSQETTTNLSRTTSERSSTSAGRLRRNTRASSGASRRSHTWGTRGTSRARSTSLSGLRRRGEHSRGGGHRCSGSERPVGNSDSLARGSGVGGCGAWSRDHEGGAGGADGGVGFDGLGAEDDGGRGYGHAGSECCGLGDGAGAGCDGEGFGGGGGVGHAVFGEGCCAGADGCVGGYDFGG